MPTQIMNQKLDIRSAFHFWRSNMVRSRQPMTVVFIKIRTDLGMTDSEEGLQTEMERFLSSQIRETDLLFQHHKRLTWGILLIQDGAGEGAALLNRLFSNIQGPGGIGETSHFTAVSSVVEIRNAQAAFEEVLEEGDTVMERVDRPFGIAYSVKFQQPPIEEVKVSIIEENQIFRNILETTIQTMHIDNTLLKIQTFTDGYSFITSDWHQTPHVHVIILNDILPKKTGLEVLHTMRNTPNQRKFIFYMMTSRKSEEQMIAAYQSGADAYLIKPFNLRLFEAQFKRTLAGLWR